MTQTSPDAFVDALLAVIRVFVGPSSLVVGMIMKCFSARHDSLKIHT